jgi:murein DD-endopeptidase MepM/ murein hydrolase activator NlpD
VIHSLSAINDTSAKDKYGMQECYNLLARYQVSAHYMIGRNQGEAWQLVPYNLIAWHAGESNWRGRPSANNFSLGVELIGSQALNNYTDWQYEELARWLAEHCRQQFLTWNELTLHSLISPGRKTDPWGLDLNRLKARFDQLIIQEPQAPVEDPKPTHTADGIPISDGFDFPVGPRGEGVNVWDTYKVDANLVDPQYQKLFNAWHTGEDWNGNRGGDTDLGDPVYAISDGRLVDSGYYTPSWGNVILLEHVLPNGTKVWSQYAHLDQRLVEQKGQVVKRGQQIGTIGKGEKTADKPAGRWIAHLHFEIRKNDLPIYAWNPYAKDRDLVLANYYSPTEFINEHRPQLIAFASGVGKRPEVTVDAPKAAEGTGLFRKADAPYWYTVPYGYQGDMLFTYSAASTETNWAEWHPNLPEEGQWEVWAHIPERNATSTSARYKIVHADGVTEAIVNQSLYHNQWVRLGKYRCGPNKGYVRLSDLTGEQRRGIMVGFDAMRFVKIN